MIPAAIAITVPTIGAAASMAYYYKNPDQDDSKSPNTGGGQQIPSGSSPRSPPGLGRSASSYNPSSPRSYEGLSFGPGLFRRASVASESPTHEPGSLNELDPMNTIYSPGSPSSIGEIVDASNKEMQRSPSFGSNDASAEVTEPHMRMYRNRHMMNRTYGVNLAHNIGLKHSFNSHEK
ncbi:hypothetical protein H4219_003531 [Mycoemilia scoparia]|uniref:Uncharacterized protein n=1 Tax=Mycoemilia scoparia TaxID=417184 RepID=A0A9W7ZZW9_9FUNG|nr:hypothetical protein H4219_003531 [Mycoemilia scoparia]